MHGSWVAATCSADTFPCELLLSQAPFATLGLLSILGKGGSCSPDMHSTSCLCPARVCRQTRVSMSCMTQARLRGPVMHGGLLLTCVHLYWLQDLPQTMLVQLTMTYQMHFLA